MARPQRGSPWGRMFFRRQTSGKFQVPWLACKPHSVQHTVLEFTPEGFILARRAWVTIYLGRQSPAASCGLPGTQTPRAAARSCLALLRMGVAWPPPLRAARWSLTRGDCEAISQRSGNASPTVSPLPAEAGGLFLWPIRRVIPAPGVTRHPALWSADFPRRRASAPRGHLASLKGIPSYPRYWVLTTPLCFPYNSPLASPAEPLLLFNPF